MIEKFLAARYGIACIYLNFNLPSFYHHTDDISDRKDALLDILPGLQADGDTPVPLKSINVIASLVDVAAEVR